MLSKDNYQNWQNAVKAYLTGYRHVRVITRTRDATTGALVDPIRPTDATELEAWETSEGIAMGVIGGVVVAGTTGATTAMGTTGAMTATGATGLTVGSEVFEAAVVLITCRLDTMKLVRSTRYHRAHNL